MKHLKVREISRQVQPLRLHLGAALTIKFEFFED
jgi:hypothetical protein